MRALVEQVYGAHPREFASPQRQMMETIDETMQAIDEHNGIAQCYIGVYPFRTDKRDYSDVVMNKAVFDFDDAWRHLVETHRWLEDRDTAHFCVFSGSDRSGHIYVLTKSTTHQPAMEYYQRDVIMDGANIDSVVDENLIGDPTSMIRVPNTMHPDARRFCIPLKPDEVTMDIEHVYDLAESQRDLRLSDIVSGSECPDVSQYADDAEGKYESYTETSRLTGFDSDQAAMSEFEAEVGADAIFEDIDCKCVYSMLIDDEGEPHQPALGHYERQTLVSYLVEEGYNPAEINRFLNQYIDPAKAAHSIHDEEQAVRIYRDGIKCPNRYTLQRRGVHVAGCAVH